MSPPSREGTDLTELGSEQDRRGFIKCLAGFIGSLLFLAPLIAGAVPILAPLFRRQSSEDGPGFDVRVAPLAQVPEDGTPRSFPIYGEERNVWNYQSNVKVGEVILARNVTEGGEIRAFSTVCPHLGCSVAATEDTDLKATREAEAADEEGNTEGDQPEKDLAPAYLFHCPCHNSVFQPNGAKAALTEGKANPSPRGLDQLLPPANKPDGTLNDQGKYTFADDEGVEFVFVRYQEFFTGRSEKIAKEL
ncbi:MAG: Rieske (2Fe-2S) protein [Pirellulales bacterium]|nr:Rieske (2Fe-2S) protein [Pirellulales bacterium]